MSTDSPVALVTGAGSGIGRASALALARAGHLLVCADIRKAEETAAEIGAGASGHRLDVRFAAEWQALVRQVLERHGRIDVLANVAGVVSHTTDTAVDQEEATWQHVIDVDLKGVWLGMRAVLPSMLARRSGRIVNIASMAAVLGLPNLLSYSAAKAGVVGMSRQVAMQYAAQGVTVNAICPGIIDTPILGEISAEMRQQFAAATPIGRLGLPEDIAATVVHLAGPGGAFITGQALAVDGGWSAQ